VVSHTGSAALRLLADRTGLTGALSKALRRRGFTPVHDRGRVLADTAVLIADGGRVMSDLAVLRDQAELFGPVASDPTLWRVLDAIGPDQRERVAMPTDLQSTANLALTCGGAAALPSRPCIVRAVVRVFSCALVPVMISLRRGFA
jgi:hypothetical protein